MHSNFGVPRNGFWTSVPGAGSSQLLGNVWPQSHSSAYYQYPQDHQFAELAQISSHQPPGDPYAYELTDQELIAALSKYQHAEKSTEKAVKLNVTSIAELIAEYRRLILSVDSSVKYLEVTKKTLSDDDWAKKCHELDQKKELLSEIDKQLGDPAFRELVAKTIKKVKAKRDKKKRRKAAWRAKKKELLEIRAEKHRKIDLWLEKMKDEVERAHRVETVKKEADLVLSEVTLKKNEAKRVLGLLNSLTKLRNAKLQQLSANKKVSDDETRSFNLVVEKLKTMWAKQLKEYNLEEQGLKVMLNDAEVERVTVQEKTWRQNLHLWTEVLFGVKNVFDPLQAQPSDPSHFTSVRENWDAFATADDSLLSSSIPCGWVLPTKPSSTEWACCLERVALRRT